MRPCVRSILHSSAPHGLPGFLAQMPMYRIQPEDKINTVNGNLRFLIAYVHTVQPVFFESV